MAITETIAHVNSTAAATTTTSGTLTLTSSSLVVVLIQFGAGGAAGDDVGTAAAMSNSGAALTWTKFGDSNTGADTGETRQAGYWAWSDGAGSRTVTHTKNTSGAIARRLTTMVVEGAHPTTPIPAGKVVVDATAAANSSASITPTADGSALWMVGGDWNATNTYVAVANNTLVDTNNVSGEQTTTLVRSTVHPRPNTSAFTVGFTTTGGHCNSIAFEIQAAAGGSPYTLTADTGTLTLTGQTAELHGPWRLVGVGTSVQVTATGHTLTLPAGVQQGDLLIAVISSRIASTTSITLPTGGEWTLCAEQKTNNVLTTTSAVASGMMAYCIRGASDPNLVFTHPTAPSVALGRIVAYRGGYVGGWLDQSNSATTAINTTAVSVAGVTTAFPGDLIVVGLCGGQEAAWSAVDATNPSVASGATDTTTHPTYNTWIERADVTTTTGSDTSLGIADAVRTAAGATGNITATASSAASHVVLIGAFRPAVVSGSPYTLTADQGSFALNGQTAVLRRGRALIAAQASFQVNGQATGLKRGLKVIAGQGAFTLTGQTAALRAIRTMPAAQGAFALNGQAAGLKRGKVLTATTAGAFTLTGQTVTLKRAHVMPAAQAAFVVNGVSTNLVYSGAGSKTLVAGVGTFALTGQTAGLLATRKMPAAQGAFTLTGQAVFLRQSNLPLVAAQGSFALNGQVAGLKRGLKVTATFGAFTLTGQVVVLGVALPAATAMFTLTGQTAATRIARKLPATFGSFTLTGQAATFKRTRVMPATFGSFAVTGQAVVLNYSGEGDVGMPAAPGFFVLNGQTATLRTIRKLVAGQGAFLLTGQTAALERSRVMPVAPGMFNAAGQAATLTVTHVSDRVMAAATGSFVLTGNVVSLDVWRVTPLEVQPGRLTFGRKVSIRRW